MNRKEFQVFAGKMFDAAIAMNAINGSLVDITQALSIALLAAKPTSKLTFYVPGHGDMPVLTNAEKHASAHSSKLEAVRLYRNRLREQFPKQSSGDNPKWGLLAAKHAVETHMGQKY